jgi:hypothetical protein
MDTGLKGERGHKAWVYEGIKSPFVVKELQQPVLNHTHEHRGIIVFAALFLKLLVSLCKLLGYRKVELRDDSLPLQDGVKLVPSLRCVGGVVAGARHQDHAHVVSFIPVKV